MFWQRDLKKYYEHSTTENFFYMSNEWKGKPHIMKLYPKGYIYISSLLKATKRDFDLNLFYLFQGTLGS